MNLVVHESFISTLERLREHPSQGILLHGNKGVGLASLAQYLADNTAIFIQPRIKNGDVDEVSGTITIERVRQLYEETRSSAVRYVIIDDADKMSHGAQNALLKLLEEPGSNIHFILTSHHPQMLLPTILSRVRSYHVPPTDKQQDAELLPSTLDPTQRAQALFLASGRPAELLRISHNPDLLSHRAETMANARTLLSDASRYARLKAALHYTGSRTTALELVDAAIQIMQHTLYAQPSKEAALRADQLLSLRDRLSSNANPRLQLLQFVLE